MKKTKILTLTGVLLLSTLTVVGCKKKEKVDPEELMASAKAAIVYSGLTEGISSAFDLITEYEGVSVSYAIAGTYTYHVGGLTEDVTATCPYISIAEGGKSTVVNPLVLGDKVTVNSTEKVVTNGDYITTQLVATLTYGDLTETKKFNVKVNPVAKVMSYEEYMAAKNNAAVTIEIIVDKVAVERKYSYNLAWGHDTNNNSYYIYNLGNYLNEDKVAVGNRVIIAGTKSIYSGFHELIKASSVSLVSKNNTVLEPIDITSTLQAATKEDDDSLKKYQGAPIKASGLIVKSIDEPTYVEGTDSSEGYYDRYNVVCYSKDGGFEVTLNISRAADDQTALKAKVAELNVDDVITVVGWGEWYNGLQITVTDSNPFTKTGSVKKTDEQKFAAIKEEVTGKIKTTVADDFTLPVSATYDSTITWASNNAAIAVGDKGACKVTCGNKDVEVTLTGTISLPSGAKDTITVKVTVNKVITSSIIKAKLAAGTGTTSEAMTVSGVVTSVEGTTFFIDDGQSSLMIYDCPKNKYVATLGDQVDVVATYTYYSGIYETKSITSVTKVTEKTITPRGALVVTEATWDYNTLKDEDNRLVTLNDVEFVSIDSKFAAYVDSNNKGTHGMYKLKIGSKSITIKVNKNAKEGADIAAKLEALKAGDKVNLVDAVLTFYKNAPQLTLSHATSVVIPA